MRSPRTVVGLTIAVLCIANLWVAFARSGIPLAFDGRVTAIEIRAEKNPPIDSVHLVTIDGRTSHLDRALAERISEGDLVRKDRFARTVEINGSASTVELSRDVTGMIPTFAILIGALAGVRLLRRKEGRG